MGVPSENGNITDLSEAFSMPGEVRPSNSSALDKETLAASIDVPLGGGEGT